ncbi:hypothetical protein CJ010_10975 [Azoarcus sp. DD4]|uniref:copper resistance CopC family protein n=1 Tax=Azoarcus sp. DD4 TaxID=2027405 RepID=UPI00112BBEC3|nr:copper resistance CopC family protein [Azoarcus sp. DD4]QDF97012.1 hypothetical protein CJ010_10975 [Azoarcus sp. DD4]
MPKLAGWIARRGIAFGLAVFCAGMLPLDASAHARLVKAEPARRAELSEAPGMIRVWFNEELEAAYAKLVVEEASGRAVTESKPQLAPDDAKSLILPLPALGPGKYRVRFRVLSVDGHVVESAYDFTVKGGVSTR